MRLLERVLTPRGARKAQLPSLVLPSEELEHGPHASGDENSNISQTPRSGASRLGKLVRLLTPRRGSDTSSAAPDGALNSPRASGTGDAQRTGSWQCPSRVAVEDARLRLGDTPGSSVGAGRGNPHVGADSDAASEADSDLSSLDGFGQYARELESEDSGEGQTSCSTESNPDTLPSPRQLTAAVQKCSLRHAARNSQRAAEDLQHFMQFGKLPTSQSRLVRLLEHADAQGPGAFADLPLHCLGYERCVAALHQLLQPLPPSARSTALAQLQSKLSAQLLSYLGSSLERVLESERGCQRFSRLPFEVVHWLVRHAPVDRGETLFDMANLWLEQQQQQGDAPSEMHRAALAALVWRRPVAADFLACMEANLPWAADFVVCSGARPDTLPPSLDGRFSFTAEFELHDLLELQHAAVASGRPQQQQSPAMYCGGYCWWAVLVANPHHNRFELYASCSPFSLFLEPFRAALQPAADVHFTFQGCTPCTSLADWRQSNDERLALCHTHWGGPAFWVPPNSPSLLAGSRSAAANACTDSGGVGRHGGRSPLPSALPPLAAAARPDTARALRPSNSRQASRLSISSSASGEGAAAVSGMVRTSHGPLISPESCGPTPTGALASSRSSLGSAPKHQRGTSSGCSGYEAEAAPLTARHLRPTAAGLVQLTMEQAVAEVRRSCPYAWGASLRVRVGIRLHGQ